jgi:hypothetical protein
MADPGTVQAQATVTVRPNGKPYRRRTPLRVETFFNDDYGECIAVLGTHDVGDAVKAAAPRLSELDLDPTAGETVWWRLVPWDTGTGHDSNWITDEVRGTPAVIFQGWS